MIDGRFRDVSKPNMAQEKSNAEKPNNRSENTVASETRETLRLPPCSAESTERDQEKKEKALGVGATGNLYETHSNPIKLDNRDLKMRGTPNSVIAQKVEEMLRLVRLEGYGNRKDANTLVDKNRYNKQRKDCVTLGAPD
jgi:hypothetical protein